MKKTLLACSILLPVLSQAQIKIGNNPGTIDPGSILELEHPNKALYLSRVSLTSTTDVATVPNPKAGMTVFNTNAAITGTTGNPILGGGVGLYVFDGTRWVGAGNGTSVADAWKLKGNAGINPATDFLGTTDANPLILRSRDSLRAIFRADGTMAFTNATPLYSDNIAEFRLNNVGGTLTSGEQNQGLNVLGQARNGAVQSTALRGRNNVAAGTTVTALRGVQGNANVEGTANGGVTAGYFNSSLKNGGALGANASMTGVAADVEAAAGSSSAATNSFTGGRFGATAANATSARTTGVLAAGAGSTASNIGVTGLSNDPTYTNYLGFIGALPAGFNAGVLGFNPGNAANNHAGYFYGKNQTDYSSTNRVMAEPGTAIPAGRELFAGQTTINGTDVASSASAAPTTLRAQVNQAGTAGNNVRTQGSLNEASTSGTGLGQFNQPQANGATGLADYVGASDAPVSDYLVGLRGAAYTSGPRTNGLNVVGVNFGGNYFRSVGGYFAPSNGSDANLGIVAQTGGTANSGWRDAQFAGKNISVAGINSGTTINDHAGFFTGSNNASFSSVLRTANNAGAIANGSDLYASHNSITGTNASGTIGSPSTIRAQYNSASSASNNLRVQGALNEAASGGNGLGAVNQPQATGVTGLADYVGTSDAPAGDYIVGVRGAAFTSSNRTNGLNVVGVNFSGNYFRSVGGYFAPSNGSDANLGVVAQTGGTENQAWKDAALASTNAAVTAMDYNTTGNHAALITSGPVRMTALNGTGSNLLTIDPATGAIGSTPAPAPAAPAWLLTGNAGITTNDFIGTTDAQQFAIRTNNTQRALYRADGSIAMGNSVPVYSDNKFEINLADVGGAASNGEQNQGVNVLASSLNGSSLSVAVRGRMDVANGKTITSVRGIQGNVSISGAASGGVTGGYFNAAMKNGGSLGSTASVTGVAADAEAGTGTGTTASTNSFTGGRFGANAANATASRATGVFAAANASTTANIGVYAVANDPTYANYITFNNGLPSGFSAGVVGFNPANAANNHAGYFYGKNQTDYSSTSRVMAEPGTAIPVGRELFAGQTTIKGTDVASTASATPTTLRAQVNQASTAGNNVRTQGSLNEASTSGTGLGQFNQPQATGATGLADYVGASDAPVSDYLVGLRGAAYTSGARTNGLNVVGANFSGNYFRSVGGYFAPSNGSDANLGVVAQTGGTENQAWKDAALASTNAAVTAMDYNTTGNHAALITSGPVRMQNLTGSNTANVLTVDPATGLVGTTTLASSSTGADNGLTLSGGVIRLGGSLTGPTVIASNSNNLSFTGAGRLGVGTSSPNSRLSVAGSISLPINTTNTNLFLNETHHTVIINGGPAVLTLPSASSCPGRIYRVVNLTGTTQSFSSTYVNFSSSASTTIPANSKIVIQTDGTTWYQID